MDHVLGSVVSNFQMISKFQLQNFLFAKSLIYGGGVDRVISVEGGGGFSGSVDCQNCIDKDPFINYDQRKAKTCRSLYAHVCH